MRRTTIWTTTATLAALALAGCSMGAGEPPERLSTAVSAVESLPEDEQVSLLHITGDDVELLVPEERAFRKRAWDPDAQAFVDGELDNVGSVAVAVGDLPWEDIWAQAAEGTEDCGEEMSVGVTPLRADEAVVFTRCSHSQTSDARTWLVGQELESLEDPFAAATVEQLFDELAVIVGDGTVENIRFSADPELGGFRFDAAVVLDSGDSLGWVRGLQDRVGYVFHQGTGRSPAMSDEVLNADVVNDMLANFDALDEAAVVLFGDAGMAVGPEPRMRAIDEQGEVLIDELLPR